MAKKINKISGDKLEIIKTEEIRVVLPRVDLEKRIANIESDLQEAKDMLLLFD